MIMTHIYYMDGKVSMVFNRNCFPKILFKVRHPTGGHEHCKSGIIKETVQDRHAVTKKKIKVAHTRLPSIGFRS